MSIPIGQTSHATVTVSATKQIRCKKCKTVFEYDMHREGSGMGRSILFLDNDGADYRAETRARKSANKKLQKEHDVVPCPNCGQVQPEMFQQARTEFHAWANYVGGIFALGGFIGCPCLFIAALNSPQHEAVLRTLAHVAGFMGACGILILIGRLIISQFHNPNSVSLKLRIKKGKRLARIITLGIASTRSSSKKKTV